MQNRAGLFALLLIVSLPAAAQEFVYPKADRGAFIVRKNVAYAEGLTFDLYRPNNDAVVPVVIFANVGIRGMKEWAGYVGWGEAIAAAGLAAVHYEATQNRIENFDALVRFLRGNASTHRIDPSRVVVWGGSSNVQVALPVAMNRANSFIKGAVIYYGAAETPDIRTDLPVYFVRAGLDSTGLNRSIDALVARALSANAPWTIENYGGGLHGFDILNDNDLSRELIRRSIEFMKRVTDPKLAQAYASTSSDADLGARFSRGEWAAAIEGYQQRVTANPRDAESHRRLGVALFETGRHAEALAEFEKAWEFGRRGPHDTGLPAARAAAMAGDTERALYWLETVLKTPHVKPEHVVNDPSFERLRENEGYRKLVGK